MTTTLHTKPRLPFRLVNKAAETIRRKFGYQFGMTYEDFLRLASKQTGLSDYGAPFIHTGLRKFFEAIEQEDVLSFTGRMGTYSDTLLGLRGRLRIVDLLNRHPEINAVPVRKPVFIIGFPRTGTSLLHRLLWQDPQFRAPLTWELWSPMPHSEPPSVDLRVRIAELRVWGMRMGAPQMRAIHNIEVHEPEECILAMPYHLDKLVRASLPDFEAWFLQHNFHEEYCYYRQILQVMQWQQPERTWALKTPMHLWKMNALNHAFPDALIIQTHRDPKTALASWCSLVAAVRQSFTRELDYQVIGQEWLRLFEVGIESAMQERAAIPSERIFDMQYREFAADPLAMMARIYDHFGLILTDEARRRMSDYLSKNRQHKFGKHTYTLEEFGLNAAAVDRAFSAYREAYHIPMEG